MAKATREAYGETIAQLVKENPKRGKIDLKNVISKEFDDNHINEINSTKLLTQ